MRFAMGLMTTIDPSSFPDPVDIQELRRALEGGPISRVRPGGRPSRDRWMVTLHVFTWGSKRSLGLV